MITAGARNVISGNKFDGIFIAGNLYQGSIANSNVVEGNFIGTDVTGTVAVGNGLAGVKISSERREICRRRGAFDVCTQPEEWCPMPAAAWRFWLHKVAGPAGEIRLHFVVGPPPSGS